MRTRVWVAASALAVLTFDGVTLASWWTHGDLPLGPQVMIRMPGQECIKRGKALRARIPPTPTPNAVVPDTSSDVVSLDRLPALGGAPGDADALVSAARSWGQSHPNDFGGLFVAAGHVYVVMARSPERNLADLRSGAEHPEQLRAVVGRYYTSPSGAPMSTRTGWGVGVSDTDPAAIRKLQERYGEMVHVDIGVLICPV